MGVYVSQSDEWSRFAFLHRPSPVGGEIGSREWTWEMKTNVLASESKDIAVGMKEGCLGLVEDISEIYGVLFCTCISVNPGLDGGVEGAPTTA